MKRFICLLAVILTLPLLAGASEIFYSGLTEAQRYDLADAYMKVADRYVELGENDKAASFESMVDIIFPGFTEVEGPVEQAPPQPQVQERQPEEVSFGGESTYYYFRKILRAVFSENVDLSLSVIGERLYLPMFDEGIDKKSIRNGLEWFFEKYAVDSVDPESVFDMHSISVTPLDNGYWRLDAQINTQFVNTVPELTFWAERIGFYFHKLPQGWRLAAIGPVG